MPTFFKLHNSVKKVLGNSQGYLKNERISSTNFSLTLSQFFFDIATISNNKIEEYKPLEHNSCS